MEKEYWLSSWETGKIGFHLLHPNAGLVNFIDQLELQAESSILVPLCGKTQDMIWLSNRGFKVTGIELSEIACQNFFTENNLHFEKEIKGKFICYRSEKIELFCG